MTREKLAELEKELRLRKESPEVKLVLQLVEAYIDKSKEHLTTSGPAETPMHQGEVRALRAVLQVFNRVPLPTQQV